MKYTFSVTDLDKESVRFFRPDGENLNTLEAVLRCFKHMVFSRRLDSVEFDKFKREFIKYVEDTYQDESFDSKHDAVLECFETTFKYHFNCVAGVFIEA